MINILEVTLESEMSWNNIMQNLIVEQASMTIRNESSSLLLEAEKSTLQKIKEWIMEKIRAIQKFFRELKAKLLAFLKKAVAFVKSKVTGSNKEDVKKTLKEEKIEVDVKTDIKKLNTLNTTLNKVTSELNQLTKEASSLANQNKLDADELIKKFFPDKDSSKLFDYLMSQENFTLQIGESEYDNAVKYLENCISSGKSIEDLQKVITSHLNEMKKKADDGDETAVKNCNELKKVETFVEQACSKTTNVITTSTTDAIKVVKVVHKGNKTGKEISTGPLAVGVDDNDLLKVLKTENVGEMKRKLKTLILNSIKNDSSDDANKASRLINAMSRNKFIKTGTDRIDEKEYYSGLKALAKNKDKNGLKSKTIQLVNKYMSDSKRTNDSAYLYSVLKIRDHYNTLLEIIEYV